MHGVFKDEDLIIIIIIYMTNSRKKNKHKKNITKKAQTLEDTGKTNPVIGILTIPAPSYARAHSHSFLPSSCVKWFEMGGARIVPIQYDLPRPTIQAILEQCNGFVTWGSQLQSTGTLKNDKAPLETKVGATRYKQFIRVLDYIYLYIFAQNIKGNYYPILGISEGSQLLALSATFAPERYKSHMCLEKLYYKESENMSRVYSEEKDISLHFTSKNNKLKSLFTSAERRKMSKEKILYTDNSLGLKIGAPYMKKYTEMTEISPTQMNIIATSKGRRGDKYVSIYDFEYFPFYGFQFMPAVTIFEWKKMNVPRGAFAHNVSDKLSQFFVDECKKNMNTLVDNRLLIYNYTLYGITKSKKILHPNGWFYKYFMKDFESAYYFNLINY